MKLEKRPKTGLVYDNHGTSAARPHRDPTAIRLSLIERNERSNRAERDSPQFIVISRTYFDRLLETQKHLAVPLCPVNEPGLSIRTLSPVDLEIVELVAKGLHNSEIGRVTGMKPRTVRAHLSDLYREFEVTNRTELIGVLVERGRR